MGRFREKFLGRAESPTSTTSSGSGTTQRTPKMKSRFRRLADRIKGPSEDRFTPMADSDPSYNRNTPPEVCEAEVSMKCLRRRRINISRKYKAVLDRGILELRGRKRSDVGLASEYRIDLAKVSVLSDDTHVVLKFQIESLLLTPLDVPIVKWRNLLNQHRQYRQALVSREGNATSAASNISVNTTGSASIDHASVHTDQSTTVAYMRNMTESLKDIYALSIEVLDKANKTLDEARQLTSEVRKMHTDIKVTKGEVKCSPELSRKQDSEESEESGKKGDISEDDVEELMKPTNKYDPHMLFSLEEASIALTTTVSSKSKETIERKDKNGEAQTPPVMSRTQIITTESLCNVPAAGTPLATQAQNTLSAKSPLVSQEKPVEKPAVVEKPVVKPAPPPAPVAPPKPKRREFLPSQQCQSEGIGFRVMCQMITSKSGLPLSNYEPLGALQIICEELQFSHLLDSAATMKLPEDRMTMVTAFALSAYTNALGRNRKPFNPLLGETFDYEENGWKYHAEQVSHHPPISAAQAESRSWSWWNTFQVEMSIAKLSKSCELTSEFPLRLRLKTHDGIVEEYSWNKVRTKIENITSTPEERRVTHDGTMVVKCSNGYSAKLHFKKGKQPNDVHGEVYAQNDRLCYKLHGEWDKRLLRQRLTGEHELLFDSASLTRYPNHYGFTRFSMGLNEPSDSIPPTDSRRRQDMRWLESANTDKATQAKEHLEKVQRSNLASKSIGYLWFNHTEDQFSMKKMYLTNGRYWKSKEIGWKNIQGIPEIFTTN